MLDAPGRAGSAADRVGLRVFTYTVEGTVGHVVNPVPDIGPEEQDGPEGCLSLPDSPSTPGAVRKRRRTRAEHGASRSSEGSELLARAIQHETDHLDGIPSSTGSTCRPAARR